MGADFFLAPAITFSRKDRFKLVLVSGFVFPDGAIIMPGGGFFTNTDGAAFCIVKDIVFNNPTLAPIGAKQSRLIRCRRCPWCCGLRHFKASYCNIINPCLLGIETRSANVNLNKFSVRISALEIRIYGCIISIHFCKPDIFCLFLIMNRNHFSCPVVQYFCCNLRIDQLFKAANFIKRHTV
ncbi:hypothetical protein D1872_263610 [compost metagenome]